MTTFAGRPLVQEWHGGHEESRRAFSLLRIGERLPPEDGCYETPDGFQQCRRA